MRGPYLQLATFVARLPQALTAAALAPDATPHALRCALGALGQAAVGLQGAAAVSGTPALRLFVQALQLQPRLGAAGSDGLAAASLRGLANLALSLPDAPAQFMVRAYVLHMTPCLQTAAHVAQHLAATVSLPLACRA
jgi:hypothetical protein